MKNFPEEFICFVLCKKNMKYCKYIENTLEQGNTLHIINKAITKEKEKHF